MCIFCKSLTNSFTSVEHIAPESLGNTAYVLPAGVVCDRCNNGVLAELDNYLLKFEPINFFRTWFQVPNKAGVIPEGKFGNMTMHATAPSKIQINLPNYRRKHFKELLPQPTDKSNQVRFQLTIRGKKQTVAESRRLARALYKIGLEFIAYDLGAHEALSARYDEIRRIILNKSLPFSGYVVVGGEKPEPKCEFTRQSFDVLDYGELNYFRFYIYGTVFGFDMTKRKLDNPQLLKENGFSVLEW